MTIGSTTQMTSNPVRQLSSDRPFFRQVRTIERRPAVHNNAYTANLGPLPPRNIKRCTTSFALGRGIHGRGIVFPRKSTKEIPGSVRTIITSDQPTSRVHCTFSL